MAAIVLRRLTALVIFLTPILVVAACPVSQSDAGPGDGDDDGGTDPGNNLIPCESRDQCPNATEWDCAGVCLKLCASDEPCGLDEYCSNGFCRRGCRDSDFCDAANDEICVEGNCTARGLASTCGSKCDCDVGLVCTDDICQAAPSECQSSADCARAPGDASTCNAFACNGFTNQCFYPNAPPCTVAGDCVGRPGCPGAECICNATGQCVIPSPCTLATELADCGGDAYCTAGGICDAFPACSDPTPCTPLDMICDIGAERCTRPIVCASNPDCAASAPATHCDLSVSSCVIPSCLNGGVTCGNGLVCQGGTCVPDTTVGDECTNHSQCDQSPWPQTEYCYLPAGQTMGVCSAGCPNNSVCPSGQICDGNHSCVTQGGGTTGSAGDACESASDCQFGLVCKLFFGTCEETCGPSDTPCNPATDANCCDLTGFPNCNPGAILSFCEP